VHVAALAEGDHLFDDGPRGLCLGDGRLDLVVEKNGGHQVAQKRAAVAGVPSEFESCIAMTHGRISL
jgi:hypothetical protein